MSLFLCPIFQPPLYINKFFLDFIDSPYPQWPFLIIYSVCLFFWKYKLPREVVELSSLAQLDTHLLGII